MSGVLAAAAANGLRQIAIIGPRRSRGAAVSTNDASSSYFSSSTSDDDGPLRPPPPPTTVTLEVRAGAGGLDASLFAAELFRA